MNVIIGSCPQCGAPIYAPGVWMSILPPPPIFTCSCRPIRHTSVTTTSTAIATDDKATGPAGAGEGQ